MVIDFTLVEIENLLMMSSQIKRYHHHEYSLSAVRKLEQARKDYIANFRAWKDLEVEELPEGKLF